MKIGITGTRNGMTPEQSMVFAGMIGHGCFDEFHHGDCIGVDDGAAKMVAHMWGENFVHSHPPLSNALRAYSPSGTILPALPYLRRNRKIVEATDILIVVPNSFVMTQRSGTWHCYRQARDLKKRRIIIWPDGGTQREAG